MLISIVAISQNNVIGCNKKLIWALPPDLKRFKELTLNKTVILGRKTFEGMNMVLPKRKSIVITRDEDFTVDDDRVEVRHDLKEVIDEYKNIEDEVYIIGGAEIYAYAMDYIDKLYITEIYKDFEGDTFFPPIPKYFEIEWESEKLSYEELNYKYLNYKRIPKL